MKTKTLKFGLAVLPLAATLILSALPARATLLAYDGFDYTAGTGIAGQSGGTGWIGPWISGGNFVFGTNVAGSLAYTDPQGNTLLTAGGSMVAGNWTSSSASTPSRTLANFAGETYGTNWLANGTYWISFLAQRIGPSNATQPYYARQGSFVMFANGNATAQGNERFDVGRPNTNNYWGTPYDTWSVWAVNGIGGYTNTSGAPETTSYALNSATYVLIELVTGTTNGYLPDTAYVWFNWTNLTIQPDISTAILVETNQVDLSTINQFRFQMNGFNTVGTNAMMQVDELRIATTFGEVAPVPEPAAVALSALGGFALLALRRKRQ